MFSRSHLLCMCHCVCNIWQATHCLRNLTVQESKRDDGKFVLIVAAVVLLPALTILGYAYFSGYLDRLSDSYTTFR